MFSDFHWGLLCAIARAGPGVGVRMGLVSAFLADSPAFLGVFFGCLRPVLGYWGLALLLVWGGVLRGVLFLLFRGFFAGVGVILGLLSFYVI